MNTVTSDQPASPACDDDRDRGSSIPLLDPYVRGELIAIRPRTVVDFGAGVGRMGTICRDVLGDDVQLTAIEGYPRAITPLRDSGIYDNVVHSLIETWVDENNAPFDVAIYGDVLEHVSRRQCFRVIRRTLRFARHVIVNVPLRNLYQDAILDNPLEEHKGYLTEKCFDKRFVIREKHLATAGEGYAKLNCWIVGVRHKWTYRSIKQSLKESLLMHGGRRAKALLDRM